MAGEVKFRGPGTANTCYFRILGSGNSVWSTSGGTGGFETFTSGNFNEYAISTTEQGVSNVYVGNCPSAVPAGVYDIGARRQVGGSPAALDPIIATGELEWNGTAVVPLSNLVTSGQFGQIQPMRIARGTMIQNFGFKLVSALDHVTPLTSGVCSGQIARDGGSFGALQSGAFTEVGLGWYNLQALTSGDLLCNTAKLVFNAVGVSGGTADQRDFFLITQRTSGV